MPKSRRNLGLRSVNSLLFGTWTFPLVLTNVPALILLNVFWGLRSLGDFRMSERSEPFFEAPPFGSCGFHATARFSPIIDGLRNLFKTDCGMPF